MNTQKVPLVQQPVAIIGMACRFPGAEHYEEFWQNLMDGRSGISEIPQERWRWKQYQDAFPGNGSSGKWGGFIKDVDRFDASFFQISGKEAELMDPQQRIMLELTWSCLEDAGLPPSRLSGTHTGVFVGVFNYDYKELAERGGSVEAHYGTGTSAALVANRLSYYYNLKGPSVPIDTACSSSLQAIHMAAQSIQVGECDMALAGGVSLLLTPARHIAFAKAGMLSPTGSCKSFDDSADGYVRGEGAGILLLKSLDKAQADGDIIYGVLRGSAANHCGKTYTITYPSPAAQAEVIAMAVKRAGIPVETINHIEAHGTGTPKGDPIEFEGLVKAFAMQVQPGSTKHNYCGVGSVKASIGHLESTAGVAGMIKVLLAMKYRKLPGVLHFGKLNSRISLNDTPFYIIDRHHDWAPVLDKDDHPYPRRAGVSSFGFGGTNAHVVLEEAPYAKPVTRTARPAYLICLSAKNREALQQKIAALAAWVDAGGRHAHLADISYTLLLGRDHFQYRKAFVAANMGSLSALLRRALESQQETEAILPVMQAEVSDPILLDIDGSDILPIPTATDYIDRLERLAASYTKGYNGNWSLLFGDDEVKRIAMPAYPFQRARYWLQETGAPAYVKSFSYQEPAAPAALRESLFTGNECFLEDHVFNGRKILPAVVYMELVHSRVQQLLATQMSGNDVVCLKNLVWMSPFIVDQEAATLQIDMEQRENGSLYYEAFSEDLLQQKKVHSCGTAYLAQVPEIPVADIAQLMVNGAPGPLEGKHFYSLLEDAGFHYGPSHQMVERLFVYKDKVFARLKAGAPTHPETLAYTLHPGYMDAALQATMGWLAMDAANGAPVMVPLPFAMQEVKVYASSREVEWAIVHKVMDKAGLLDIDLCDASGKVCVQMKGYSGRIMVRESISTIDIVPDDDVCKLESLWSERQTTSHADVQSFDNHIVVLCDSRSSATDDTDVRWQNITRFTLKSEAVDMENRFADYCWKLMELVQDLFARHRGKTLMQVVVDHEGPGRLLAGLSGLLKTVSTEYTKFQTQIIEYPKAESKQLLSMLLANKASAADRHVRYRSGKRWVKSWRYVPEQTSVENPWRNKGVYLITGGAGGLGLIFATEIAGRTTRATIILSGRSPLSRENEARLQALRTQGNTIRYRQLDVTDAHAVRETMDWIRDTFGGLHGIVHAAGIINDNYIIRKTRDELEGVLAPKVAGLINLDEASAGMKLDLFVLFSSTSGALGNIGQSDYSAANNFMDEYACYRNTLRSQGLRSGRCIAISWPFWKDGGMRLTETGITALYRYAGMVPMETEKGINAFYTVLQSEQDHVMVMQGDRELLLKRLQCDPEENTRPASGFLEQINELKMNPYENEQIKELIQQLIYMAAGILKSSAADIDPKAPLDEYGFDSILYTEFALRLNETFQTEVAPTLFFQYDTIAALAAYLIDAGAAGPQPAEDTGRPGNRHPVRAIKEDMLQWLTGALCGYAAAVLKVPATDIDPGAGMDKYSYDSIAYTEFAIRLNDAFGLQLAPTLFFEHATLSALAAHLLDRWPSVFEEKFSSKAPDQELPGESLQMEQRRIANGKEDAGPPDADPSDSLIAIIGVSGSFAMSEDLEALWKNLIEERDCISEIPADRWDWQSHFGNAVSEQGKTSVKWGGFMKDLNAFDAAFFNISPGEAAYIDPQQRLLLMHVWKTLEDAGYAPQDFYGSNTALFTGITSHEYSARVSRMNVKTEGYHQASIISCIGPNRVSYFLNLHGTSEPVDTACSSSLVAIHRAVREIRSGDSEMAIAGGVTVLSSLPSYISFDKAGMLSRTGRSKTFSDQADGYARGEGIGVVLLKRLDAAERDGDHIYGVIKGSAVNHGGRANSLQAPNMRAQAALLKAAYSKAGIDPRTVGYIEAHGTGTRIGDPIEVDALKAAFKELYGETGNTAVDTTHCGLGSLKTNIGHSEYAAGIAGVIKVLLQMKHRTLVKTLHCDTVNPYIDLKGSPFFIVRETQPWKALRDDLGKELPRRAGVSSFGFGGVNAHVILEEYIDKRLPQSVADVSRSHPAIFVLSAKKAEQLKVQVQQLLEAIQSGRYTGDMFRDVAYTLQVGRNAMEERLCILADTFSELAGKLERFLKQGTQGDGLWIGQVKRVKPGSGTIDNVPVDKKVVAAISTHDYRGLAQLWIDGYAVPWALLYTGTKPRRLSLPTYPFSKDVFTLNAEYTLVAKTVMPMAQPVPEAGSTVTEKPRKQIQEVLVANIARLLNMDARHIMLDENLDEYGFDSVLYTQFSIELNEQFGWDLTPAIFFRYPDIEQLSAYLSGEYPATFNTSGHTIEAPSLPGTGVDSVSHGATAPVEMLQMLTGKVAQILKFSEDLIDPHADLNEYGLDSIIVTQLTSELNEAFNIELTPNIIFGCQNLNALSVYLQDNYTGFFSKAPSDPRADVSQGNEPLKGADSQPAPFASSEKKDPSAVAIVGLSIQFPMAKDAGQFWDNLVEEKHCIAEIPADRWDWRDYPELKIKWGGFMDDMATFDPLFFKISPAEALQMDPQQRLLMQHAWKAIEDAGYDPHSLSGSNTGVFAGVLCYEYSKLLAKADVPIASHSLMGMVGSMGPNRISYFLDIHGPSEAIETACSSSLVAIHRAVEAIRSGACDTALAGGVNTLLSPDVFVSLDEAGTLSPDGVCRPFSDQAKGYVRGEGTGVVFLKRLEDAERDGDHIYAVVRSTTENHGGRANTLTSPNPKAQAALLHTAYRKAGIDPRTVGYIETHGTGTELGDPIEVGALRKAFGQLYEDNSTTFNGEKHCGIGSVKANIGHLEVAAGIAGVAKVLLQMKHKKLVKSLHCERLNPYIDFNDGPFYVVNATEEWKALCSPSGEALPRRAGVSSFGFGGVSAHIVLEEYIPKQKPDADPGQYVVVLSAKNRGRLSEYAEHLRNAIEKKQVKDSDMASLAYTLQTGREAMEERLAMVVDSLSQLRTALHEFISGDAFSGTGYLGSTRQKAGTNASGASALLSKMAAAWVQGEDVDWRSLYGDEKPMRMSLPTYPFERKRFWPLDPDHKEPEESAQNDQALSPATDHNLDARAIAYFKHTIAGLVKIPVSEIRETEMLIHYGVDSIAISRLLVKMKSVMPKVTNSVVFEHPTIAELVAYLVGHEQEGLRKLLGDTVAPKEESYCSGNSMLLLNEGGKGKPVFWFHPGGDGIDGYQYFAEASERPFYGIVADQWIRERKHIRGIPEMAAEYLRMIRSIQPEGPYDLGGFSLGGALAYEATRQLQLEGQRVSTITMIDSVYVPELMGKFLLDYKTMLLQTVNLLLMSSSSKEGIERTARLIHRRELDTGLSNDAFLDQVMQCAQQRGFAYPVAYLNAIVAKGLKVRDASEFADYKVLPLIDPAAVRCDYFVNGTQSFYGALAPYFILNEKDNVPLEQVDYWAAWEKQLLHFRKTELPVTDHVTLMNDRNLLRPVIDHCKALYASRQHNVQFEYATS
ncbi:SDR family NAD(P)-dependent oxidoreductase [Taibaiella koreensis]|uniref:SDR family NAD(P)-dependent oxidoreductase n=1 Tax=Taibaiella koreensis TaxID=1268548 RepID=UPI0013C2D594|nr:SDR family NAD(P)-dependent oxidoreductase [Taibaiella koreensis]